MNNLRRAHRLVWHALAWFALSIGAAVASAAVQPQAMELICSEHGAMMVVTGDHGTSSPGHKMGDCPLCITAGAPPPVTTISVPHERPAHAPTLIAAADVATFASAPPPARGPPSI